MSAFLDTNILVYAAGLDRASAKVAIADRLVNSGERHVLSLQVLNEFVVQATKPSRQGTLPIAEALRFVETLRGFDIVAIDLALFDRAGKIQLRTNYSWWDCLIVAAAVSAGCDMLYTEDMQDGRVIDGIRIENPFRDLA